MELQPRGLSCLTDPGCPNEVMGLVVRDMAPGLMVMAVLAFMAANFVRGVYGLKSRREGFDFLQRRLLGSIPLSSYMPVKEGKLALSDKDILARVGGPAVLTVHNDSAVVLERAGKLTRVLKKGTTTLDAFEKVWDVVDLRPQRWVHDVNAMSKDGIPVRCQADVTFKIDSGGQSPSQDDPYPAKDEAIFIAATRKWMRESSRAETERVFDWSRRAIIGVTEGTLRGILATYLLDQLLGSAEPDKNHYRAEVLDKLKTELNKAFPTLGLVATKVELGNITVADEIAQQRIEAWRALWQRWTKKREAQGEAERLRYVEDAKAQAQADMIVAITQAFQSLTETGARIPSQFVLLRMLEVLKRSSFDPQVGTLFLPAELIKSWNMVREMALGKSPE